MSHALDGALPAAKTSRAEICNKGVFQLRIFEGQMHSQFGQIEADPFRMRRVFGVDRVDCALPETFPPRNISYNGPVREHLALALQFVDCAFYCFLAET